MPNLNISHKLMLVVAALVVILLTTFCMFVVKINATSHLLENVAHPEKGLVVLTDESRLLQSIFKELRIAMIKYPMTVGTDERNKQKEAFKAQKQKFIEVLQIIQMRCDGKSEQCVGIAKSMINDLDDYEKASYNEVVRLTEINENREAYLAVQKFLVPIGSIIDAKVDSLVKVIDEKVETVQKKLESATSVWGIVTVNTLGLLLTVFIISVTAKSILKPIRMLGHDADLVSKGDLSVDIDDSSNDEIGVLAKSFKRMVENLRDVVSNLESESGKLSTESKMLIENNNKVDKSSEKILEQSLSVAAASEEMANITVEISHNCTHASNSSADAQKIVSEGVDKVRSTVCKIREHTEHTNESASMIYELGDRTSQISSIVGTIQEIAEQTNLLALNAAIEAARAGEHGRGFAVVADEVRSLAARTSGSTKEISDMITAVQEMVHNATSKMDTNVAKMNEIAEDTVAIEESLASINHSVESVHNQIIQIVSAAEQQAETTREMSHNMQLITDATRATTHETKNCLDIAAEIASVSENMNGQVSKFNL